MKTILFIVKILFLAASFSGSVAWAQSSSIVDLDYVKAAQQRGVILWDVRSTKNYLDGHIPGAINIGEIGATLRDPNREDYMTLPISMQSSIKPAST